MRADNVYNRAPEQIVAKLCQPEALTSQGETVAEVMRSLGVTEFAYYL